MFKSKDGSSILPASISYKGSDSNTNANMGPASSLLFSSLPKVISELKAGQVLHHILTWTLHINVIFFYLWTKSVEHVTLIFYSFRIRTLDCWWTTLKWLLRIKIRWNCRWMTNVWKNICSLFGWSWMFSLEKEITVSAVLCKEWETWWVYRAI